MACAIEAMDDDDFNTRKPIPVLLRRDMARESVELVDLKAEEDICSGQRAVQWHLPASLSAMCIGRPAGRADEQNRKRATYRCAKRRARAGAWAGGRSQQSLLAQD